MPVPKYNELMLPYLQFLGDGAEHKHSEATEAIADHLKLTESERRELLPSGRQTAFKNRSGWARTYLKKAGLIEQTRHGWHRITPAGFAVLEDNPTHIDRHYLMQFTEFVEFQNRSNTSGSNETKADLPSDETPEDTIEASYSDLREKLINDVLERIKENSPQFFEALVIDLLLAMGYGGSRRDAGQAVGRSGDGGIDGIIKEDHLGLNNIYVQAKRWDNTVGRPDVQGFSGALDMHRANHGVFITTSSFSAEARDFVQRIGKKIVLIDGQQLANFMIDFSVGVTTKAVYTVYEIDENYFDDE